MAVHVDTHQKFVDEVLNYDGVVLVDFYADWCGPCRMLAPIVDELSNDYAGKNVKIVKVNVDNNQETAMHYQVMSIPAVFVFKAGQQIRNGVGVSPKWAYENILNDALTA